MKTKLLNTIIMCSKLFLYAFCAHFIFFSLATAKSNSQQLSVEEIFINVEVNRATAAEIFQEIENKSEFKFAYEEKHLNERRLFSFFGQYSIANILREVGMKASLNFRRINNTIDVAKTTTTNIDKIEEIIFEKMVTGKVTDSNGESLPGVNVLVKGTTIGTVTDITGSYTINVPNDNDVLLFSFIGYESKSIAVNGRSQINVTLAEDVQSLNEVVVVGYGTQKKSSVTSAISKVENEILDQVPTGRAESALVGRMAGVNISQTRSTPGASPTITIRGPGSISASNDPLIVIDGFPGGSFDNININDVESIEVLKDASAAAIYGSRGSGGVIIVTTKKGKSGKAQMNFNSYYGIATPMTHGVDAWIPGGQEFYEYTARYINRDFAWAGGDTSLPLWGDERRPSKYRVNPVIAEGNYNWEDILLDPAPIQNYNLSVRGGTDDVTYYVSGTVRDEDGTFRTTGYKQYAVRANINVKVNDAVNMGMMISPNYSKRRTHAGGLQNLVKMPPFLSPEKQEDGSYLRPRDYWGSTVSGSINPLATLDGSHQYSSAFNNVGEMFVDVNIWDNLKFKTSLGVNTTYRTSENFYESWARGNGRTRGNAADTRNVSWVNENVLSYDKTFNDIHSFSGILGASYQQSHYRSARINAVDGTFANEKIWTLNNAIISPSGSYTTKSHWGLASYFSRVNYGYKDKYLASASLRTDGSSRFGPENRWGFFPSGSVAWRLSEEAFLQDVATISNLKLRASYGVVGNFNIGDFQYLGTISDAVYSPNGELTQGMAQSSFGNPELKWERTESYDIGFELGLFENRVNLVFDYYNKQTNDLLYNVSIPSISGFTSTIVNVGDVNNRGIELELNTHNLTGALKWETSFNFSRNKNSVTSLGGGVDEVINTHSRGMGWLLRVGEPMFSYYGYEKIGVLMNQQDVENSPIMPGQKPGTVKYRDVNNDGTITPEDRVILGNFMPDYFLGMVNDFSYKNFDLSIAMQSSIGAKMYNLENLYYQGATVSALLIPIIENQWWSEEEPGDGMSPATSLAALEYVGNSDDYLEDASFLAIRNINLGYTIPNSLLSKIKLNSLRVYVSVSNALMLTKDEFNAYNPEGFTTSGISGIRSLPGLNNGSEPLNRTVVLGLNLNF